MPSCLHDDLQCGPVVAASDHFRAGRGQRRRRRGKEESNQLCPESQGIAGGQEGDQAGLGFP